MKHLRRTGTSLAAAIIATLFGALTPAARPVSPLAQDPAPRTPRQQDVKQDAEPQKEGAAPPKSTIEVSDPAVTPLPLPKGAPPEIKALIDDLAKDGATVDFEKKKIVVKGAILLDKMNPNYPIEYLLVTNSGYTHEALGIVRVTPSKLNAAFLALGLQPGRTVQFVKRTPEPPAEKLISGEESEFDVIPPTGPVVDIVVHWKDEKGEHIHPIEDMIQYLTNGRPLPRRGFCFIGSRFAHLVIEGQKVERFMADVEGNLVSLYLSGSGNCVFDMNSDEGVEQYLYDVNPAVVPKRGTIVTFEFNVR